MKRIVAVIAFLALIQNWHKIEGAFRGPPVIASTDKVILYSTSWCGYCKKTRALLEQQNIAFIEYDIEKSSEGRRQYDDLNGRGVPVLNAKGTIIYGYNKQQILATLK